MADKKSQYDVGFDKKETKMKKKYEVIDVPPENMNKDQFKAWETREIMRLDPLLDKYNLLYKEMLVIKDIIGPEWIFELNKRHEEYYLKRRHPLHKGKELTLNPASWDIPNSRDQ